MLNRKFLIAVAFLATNIGFGATTVSTSPVQAQMGGGGWGARQRNAPKSRLRSLLNGVRVLEAERKAALTPTQAKAMLAAINPWRSRPRMTDNDAKALYMKLNSVLTIKQKNELDKIAAKNRRFGGRDERGGGAGAGAGGGAGGARGGAGRWGNMSDAERAKMRQTMQGLQGFMKTYNSFYPPTKYRELSQLPERMREGFTRRFARQNQFLAQLAAKARTAKA